MATLNEGKPAGLTWTEDLFRALTLHSADIISVLDAQGRLLYNSPATERINGYTAADLEGVETLTLVHPDDRARVGEAFARVLAAPGAVATVEYRYRAKDGRWQWMEAVASNQLQDPVVRGVVSHTRDITARREAEERRRALEGQLLESRHAESLAVLAGGVAHDFNNLLAVILGEATLLTHAPTPEALREATANIEASARRASDLTQLLLAYAGRTRVQLVPTALGPLVEQSRPLLVASIPGGPRLQLDLEPGLPLIAADASQVRQVLLNLASNAGEALATPGLGLVTVRVRAVQLDAARLQRCALQLGLAPGPAVMLEVSDDGVGMAPEVQARMLDPFFTTRQAGRGLGLSAVAGIMRAHQGALEVDSAPGRGTRVAVFFPLAVGTAPQTSREGRRYSGRALVVDDEPMTGRTTARLLSLLGFEVDTAGDGRDALDRFGEHLQRYEVVVLDMVMPRMDGAATFRALRERRADLPVLFISGYDQGIAEALLDFPRTAFLNKPFSGGELSVTLDGLTPHARTAPVP